MNLAPMKNAIAAAATLHLLLAVPAAAQAQATALSTAARSAAVIVRATVVAATDPSPEWHRLQFRTVEVKTRGKWKARTMAGYYP